MDVGRLFSFRGRVGRGEYWLFVLLGVVPSLIYAINETVGVIAIIVYALLALSTNVKRWHDRNKSGWWVLISLVPIIGAIWSLIELGILPGTDGANTHGLPGSGSLRGADDAATFAPVSRI